MSAALDTLTARGNFQHRVGDTIEDARNPRVYSPAQEAALLDRLLAIQADRSLPWKQKWGDVFIHRMIEPDGITPARRDAFLRNMQGPATLTVRPRVRLGDPLPVRVEFDHARGASVRHYATRIATADVRMTLDGRPLEDPAASRDQPYVDLNESGWSFTLPFRHENRYDAAALAGLSPGSHVLAYRASVRLIRSTNLDGPPIVTLPIEASATFTLVPAEEPTVEFVADESMRPAMEASAANAGVQLLRDRGAAVSIYSLSDPPMPVSFRVTVRQGAREWHAGRYADRRTLNAGFRIDAAGLLPGKFDLILTADAAAAVETVDVTRAWQGEIVVRDVPVEPYVERRRSTTRGAARSH